MKGKFLPTPSLFSHSLPLSQEIMFLGLSRAEIYIYKIYERAISINVYILLHANGSMLNTLFCILPFFFPPRFNNMSENNRTQMFLFLGP